MSYVGIGYRLEGWGQYCFKSLRGRWKGEAKFGEGWAYISEGRNWRLGMGSIWTPISGAVLLNSLPSIVAFWVMCRGMNGRGFLASTDMGRISVQFGDDGGPFTSCKQTNDISKVISVHVSFSRVLTIRHCSLLFL